MLSEIKLLISENEKIIDTVVKETKTEPSNLLKSLQEFQHAANAALTKMIEEQCDRNQHEDEGDNDMDCGEDDSEDDDEDDTEASPRKKKK